jgi:hypothetical protein
MLEWLFSYDLDRKGLKRFFCLKRKNPVCFICGNDTIDHQGWCWVGVYVWVHKIRGPKPWEFWLGMICMGLQILGVIALFVMWMVIICKIM